MSVTQTVDIPASHRLTIDIPREIPQGRAVLTFTLEPMQGSTDQRSDVPPKKTVPSLASLMGIDKGRDTMDAYFARKRADKERENAQIARQLGLDELPKIGAK